MISLSLNHPLATRPLRTNQRQVTLEALQDRLLAAVTDCSVLIEQQQAATVEIPTDLLFHAASTLFPPERMLVVSGRRVHGRLTLGAAYDVTGSGPGTHSAHVEADHDLLRKALISFERAGVELGAWIHSHPGSGPSSTHPSQIDRRQHDDWTRHFSSRLICLIFVADGHFRLWGEAIECGLVRPAFVGDGVVASQEERHVYRLAR